MPTQLGLVHFWQQGDVVTHATALLLLLLSVGSWALIVGRLARQLQTHRACDRAPDAFWQARSLPEALRAIDAADRSGLFAGLAQCAADCREAYDADTGLGAGVSLSEALTRSLRNRMLTAQAGLESGLSFLASVGATAPFIGLFGTVWGIYHALISLSGSTSVVLDKVAGPVGEALVMTAAGLFVAIPAVLAYNALTRANRLVIARLDGFAHDLHAWFATGHRRVASADFSAARPATPVTARQAA